MSRFLVFCVVCSAGACGEGPEGAKQLGPGIRIGFSDGPERSTDIAVDGETVIMLDGRGETEIPWQVGWGNGSVNVVVQSENVGTLSFNLTRQEHARVHVCETRIVLDLVSLPDTFRQLNTNDVCSE